MTQRNDDPQGAHRMRQQLHRPPATARHSKVVRWVLQLTDAQIIELTRRVCQVMSRSHDVDAQALRLTWAEFAANPPSKGTLR